MRESFILIKGLALRSSGSDRRQTRSAT